MHDHRLPYPGDNGFQFEAIKGFAEYKKRRQFANYQSLESIQDALNTVYEILDQAHEKRALLPFADNEFTVPNPPQNTADSAAMRHKLIPVQDPHVQAIRDLLQRWEIDSNHPDNEITIWGITYRKIYDDFPAYLSWLQEQFETVRTKEECFSVLQDISYKLKANQYPE